MTLNTSKPILMAALAAVIGATACHPARAAGIPVVDGTAIKQGITHHLEEVAKFVEQIAVAREQLDAARRQYDSITGIRGFGDLMSNPAIRRSLPEDMQRIWRHAEMSGDGLSRSIERIRGEERLSGRYSLDRQGLLQRIEQFAETTKALGERAYEGLDMRQEQVDELQRQISRTQDPKAISELQARVAIEGHSIEVDAQRLALMRQQADAERLLISQQENALAQQGWFDTGALRGRAALE
ncbi:plasmid-related exported protein [Bordetella ansorpii]|uniref:Plasmid-related exported protein n=1 Tax=Bordetella ansorpii TaxID=288768 RepID=A0A157QKT2_9BORD|nr:P-type DNA transfer protein VirB5 [Bordetella ansorpii]SAI46535.1 plasmid-related exported protein [Bordetella ansorpii]